MLTVVETPTFQRLWPNYWTEPEYDEFIVYMPRHADTGVVIPGAKGLRKIRWRRGGMGKSGGVRVVYYIQTVKGQVVLLSLFAKAELENLSFAARKEIRRALGE